MAQLPTITDVATAAGVSRQTVSNVLNSPDIVREDTRERVEAAISSLGYRTHASARRLRTRKSSTIGIRLDPMANGISGSIHDRYLHALTEQADARGMRMLLFTAADPSDEIAQFSRLLDGADVDAFVLTSTFHGDPRTEWLIEQGAPFVTFGRPWGIDDLNDPQHLWVDVDGQAGLAAATEHLRSGGASRIAYVGWPAPSGTGDDRRLGWERVVRSSLGYDDATIARRQVAVVDSVPAARAAVTALLDQEPDIDGIVCASDSLALGTLMAVTAAGRAELPIVGFDNTPVAEAVGLSSVEQRLDEVATRTLELLMGERGRAVVRRALTPGEAHRLVTPSLVARAPVRFG